MDRVEAESVLASPAGRPWAGRELHFIGIGGCGMSGLALLSSHLGARVSGSDQKESIFTASLKSDPTIVVAIGHRVANVPVEAEIVYSSAIGEDNVERAYARRRGQHELHRSELLAQLTRERRTVAVAGAHGKTTTSALLAHVLTSAGKDPSYIVGGLMQPPAAHARLGRGEILVIEADESDRSLLNYDVEVAVITNIDLDHVGDAARFTSRADVASLLRSFAERARCVVTTPRAAVELNLSDDVALISEPTSAVGSFVLHRETYHTNLSGEHGVISAGLVVDTAMYLGCTTEQIESGLASFPGLKRRFEFRGMTDSGARVFDDYAHHPTEVAATIAAARTLTAGPVVVVFQPHLFSRTAQFASEFAAALATADMVILDSIYPARESQASFPDVTSLSIVANAPDAARMIYPRRDSVVVDLVHEHARTPEAIVLLVGAGDVGRLADVLVGRVASLR